MSLLTKNPATKPEKPASEKKKGRDKKSGEKAPKQAGGRRRAQSISASVNLLSPWVFEEMRVRTLRQRFVAAAIVLLLVVAATWGLLRMTLANAESDLRDDEAAAAGLQKQIADLSDVSTFVSNVTVRTNDIETTLADEAAVSRVMSALEKALPAGAAYTSVVITLAGDPALAGGAAETAEAPLCPGPDPFGALEVVGCVELAGDAQSRADVSDLIEALAADGLFVEPFINTVNASTDEDARGVEFAGSTPLTEDAYSNRYADLDGSDAADAAEETDR